MDVGTVLPLVLGISVLSLVVAAFLAKHVLAADTGKAEMRQISDAIREGAEAFLKRQYRTIAALSVVAALLIFGFYFANREVKNIAEQHSRDLTRALRILGTPLYMAPERLRDPADVDARADIYAVGAVAFFLLTGHRMFEAADDLALTTKVLNDEPPRVAAAAAQQVPLELDLLVQACLEKKREHRPQRVTDLVEAFEALAQEQRWTQREAESWWAAVPPPRPAR